MGCVERLFYHYGKFVARHPYPFIVLPLLLTGVTMFGLLNFYMEHNVWSLYLPADYYGYIEEEAMLPFDAASGKAAYTVRVLFSDNHNQSLYTHEALAVIGRFNNDIENGTFLDDYGESLHYTDLCKPVCRDLNAQVIALLKVTLQSSRYDLQYPIVRDVSPDAFIGYTVGQKAYHTDISFEYNDGTDEEVEVRSVSDKLAGYRLMIMTYFVRSKDIRGGFTSTAANNIEKIVRARVSLFNEDFGDKYTAVVFSPQMMSEAMIRFSMKSIPYSAITACVLIVFMLLTLTMPNARHSQHFEAVTGIIGPGMAIISGFCTMFAVGVPFTNLLAVIPFLVLVIGVDDAFLILAAWRHTDLRDSIEHRAGMALSRAGTSVTITSITDIACFMVGLQTSMPITQIFSIYCATSLAFDYLYQMTFFLAATTLWETQKAKWYEQSRVVMNTKHNNNNHTNNNNSKVYADRNVSTAGLTKFSVASKPSITALNEVYCDTDYHELALFRGARKLYKRVKQHTGMVSDVEATDRSAIQRKSSQWMALQVEQAMTSSAVKSLDYYVNLLHRCSWIKIILVVSYPIHLMCALYLCAKTVPQFSINRLYTNNEEIMETSTVIERFLYHDCYTVNYITTNPPDLMNITERNRFMHMIDELESIEHYSYGRKATRLWLFDYLSHVEFWDEESAEELQSVVRMGIEKQWVYATTPHNRTFDILLDTINAFWWTQSYHNITKSHQMTSLIRQRRNIVDDYPEFGVFGSHQLDKISDLFQAIPDKMMKTTGSAVILMSIVVMLIVRDIRASFWVIQSLFSICAGVIGYSSLFAVDLDGITMLAVLMIVGVAVDFTSHIAYHFFTYDLEEEPRHAMRQNERYDLASCLSRERLYDTLLCAGWPTLQGIVSSAIGMMPIVLVGAYLVHVFWTIIVIAAVLGAYHTLFLFPTAFIMFHAPKLKYGEESGDVVFT